MSILRGFISSYSIFGPRGVALVAKSRLLGRRLEVRVSVPGLKHPVHVRLRTSDVSLLSEILGNSEYNPDFPTPPQIIVDAGANTGLTSVFYANKYPQARVIAIEPEASNFQILKKNAAPYPNISCVQAALWKEDTSISIADPGTGHWGFQIVEGEAKPNASEVEAITVDTLMKRFGIDYIDFFRIDIEGAEREVFENASPWIDRVGVVAVELHDRLKPGCSRALYLATKNFQWEVRDGETVFLGREERGVKDALQPDASSPVPHASAGRARGKRLCTILSTT